MDLTLCLNSLAACLSFNINPHILVLCLLLPCCNPDSLTADAAEKPAVLLYFLSFWCLVWADSNPMSHLWQQVPSWLPLWHVVQSLTHLHNSFRLLLSHQPCFVATVTWHAVKRISYNQMTPFNEVVFSHSSTHIHTIHESKLWMNQIKLNR